MNELIDVATKWHSLPIAALVFMLTFGVAPGLALRIIVLIYPKGDPRRQELVAQLYVLGRLERLQFVGEQLETALTDGLGHRIRHVRDRRAKKRKERQEASPRDIKRDINITQLEDGVRWTKSSASKPGKHRPERVERTNHYWHVQDPVVKDFVLRDLSVKDRSVRDPE